MNRQYSERRNFQEFASDVETKNRPLELFVEIFHEKKISTKFQVAGFWFQR